MAVETFPNSNHDIFHKYPSPKPGVIASMVEEEAVVLLAEKAQVKVLNTVGARIWQLADGTKTVRDIINHIVNEYDVDTQQAEPDIIEFLDLLWEKGMIELLTIPKVNNNRQV